MVGSRLGGLAQDFVMLVFGRRGRLLVVCWLRMLHGGHIGFGGNSCSGTIFEVSGQLAFCLADVGSRVMRYCVM